MSISIVHYPVMKEEIREFFPVKDHGQKCSMIDCTLGEGGHTEMLLTDYPGLKVTGLDRDSDILEKARQRLASFDGRFEGVNAWFDEYLKDHELGTEDFVLFDLGISTFHYQESHRGFSFQRDEELDMRLCKDAPVSAQTVVNEYSQEQLADVIFNYGEERYSRRIAKAIVEARSKSPVRTTAELENIIYNSVPLNYRHGRIHPATRTFQAIRIEVNKELDRIGPALDAAIGCLKPKGRIAVITFHSLEDRIAKWTFKKHLAMEQPDIVLVNKKPLEPTKEECDKNPPSRSAKLRVVEKLEV